MRWGAAALVAGVLGGCGFSISGGPGDDGGGDDGGGELVVTDDSAADFMAGTLGDGTIAARGAIEPDAYAIGGLHARGYIGQFVASTSTFETVLASLPQATGERYRLTPGEWMYDPGRPRGLGLTSGDNYTVVLDGEIRLSAGEIDVAVRGDDDAIMQVSLDGGVTWSARAYDNALTPDGVISLTVPAEGWYPIRIAVDEDIGAASLHLLIDNVLVTEQQLRARVTDAQGMSVTGYANVVFLSPVGEALVPTIDSHFLTLPPPFDLTINDFFTLRHSGQILIEEAGDYAFTVEVAADDFYRVMIDGVSIAENFPGSSLPTTGTITLAPGWHDLTVDYTEYFTDATVRLLVTGGNFSGVVPTTHLRPVVAKGLVAAAYSAGPVLVLDATNGGPTTTTTVLDLAKDDPTTVIELVDWYFDLNNRPDGSFGDVQAALECPGATNVPAFPPNGGTFILSSTTCTGGPVPEDVVFRLTDTTVGGAIVTAINLYAGASYHGGDYRQPYARTTTFESSVKALPGATAWGPVALAADARGATITLEVRAAADETALQSAAWVAVADGEVPQAPIGEVAQYRITIETDGWQLASVDRVELRYLTGP